MTPEIQAPQPGAISELKARLDELCAAAEARIPPILPVGTSAAALAWMTDEEVRERHEIVMALTRLKGGSAADAAARVSAKHAAGELA